MLRITMLRITILISLHAIFIFYCKSISYGAICAHFYYADKGNSILRCLLVYENYLESNALSYGLSY